MPWMPAILYAPFSIGWAGVDLFFVLSGFLITAILLESRRSPNYFSSFYARRVLRIFPIYILAVFLYFHLALPLMHYFGLWPHATADLEPWYWMHLSNWRSAFGDDVPLLTHFWSLSVEEQFYLAWPLAVFLIGEARLGFACFAIIAASFAIRCVAAYCNLGPEAVDRLTPCRAETLAVGALVAIAIRNPRLAARLRPHCRSFGMAALAAFLCVLAISRTANVNTSLNGTLGVSAVAWAAAALVFAARYDSGAGGRWSGLLRSRALTRFGKYSYAIYVFHLPIAFYMNQALLAICRRLSSRPERIGLWLASIVLGSSISYAVALASWELVEKRFLALKSHFEPASRARAAAA